ncbi:MAG: Mur ligase family protein [Acidobacteriota bacterium]|nr:Mur ligase family protein [Acidobacteriota bacterium]
MAALAPLLARLEREGIRLGLEATRALLAALDDPQLRFPSVLVAGTNGKGSTAALLAAILQAAGLRTGLYTSPHLERPAERIRVDGLPLPDRRLARLLAEVVAASTAGGGRAPTYFEAMTAAAFLAFARQRVDLAVLEVGMGGRLDATNLARPELSLVTAIDLDHREFLGETRAAIAREKAGIFRPGRPALALAGSAEATAALAAEAAAVGASFLDLGPWLAETRFLEEGWEGQRLAIVTPAGRWRLRLPLAGRHQAANLLLAVHAAERLRALGWPAIGPAAIRQGVAATRWPGRLESVLLPTGDRVLLDAAHNPDGARRLAEFLAARGARGTLLFGALDDKDAAGMLAALAPHADRVVFTEPASPRARPAASLPALLPAPVPAQVVPDRGRALSAALRPRPPLTVVSGSIFLLGDLRRRLRRRYGLPPP